MFRREHNLRFYAKQNATDHWISNGFKFFKGKFKLLFFSFPGQKRTLKSFHDFARWIAFDTYQNKNKHFRPQSDMCPPCRTKFSYIVKGSA